MAATHLNSISQVRILRVTILIHASVHPDGTSISRAINEILVYDFATITYLDWLEKDFLPKEAFSLALLLWRGIHQRLENYVRCFSLTTTLNLLAETCQLQHSCSCHDALKSMMHSTYTRFLNVKILCENRTEMNVEPTGCAYSVRVKIPGRSTTHQRTKKAQWLLKLIFVVAMTKQEARLSGSVHWPRPSSLEFNTRS
ncbi:hypothetical protein VNO77_27314 [Canavalia gladiata]|uniref:Uncharacterized protein n=1 Tax=Canavalia gladiata TaxID=3824 RepID=A0AAN9KUJ4_CANGL